MKNTSPAQRTPHLSGFTLIEMLVAVGLVVLMMSLFATIFQMSTGAMATQKGIAENDQRSRLALTLLRGDLKNRTALIVQPFEPGETGATSDRNGYFYIGENDRDDDTDDVLAFTVTIETGGDPYFGHAALLAPDDIAQYPNQPEFDDGIAGKNNAGSSQYAEVCYFLRKGTLYRRVLLIRQPIKDDGLEGGTPKLGTDGQGAAIDLSRYESGGNANFLTEMDYSSYYKSGSLAFHGVADLKNGLGASLFGLGKPNYRFGHNHATGLPREFVGTDFIGRFTHWETSYQPLAPYTPMVTGSPIQYFGYPGRVDGPAPNPMDPDMDPGTPGIQTLTYDADLGLVTNYSLKDASNRAVPGRRASEDILLTRVQRFDIKVWDEQAGSGPDGVNQNGAVGSDDGDFRDVGHNGATGFYRDAMMNSGQTPVYCGAHPANGGSNPISRTLYRFDTWNPNVNLDGVGATSDPPPFSAPLDGSTRRPLRAIQIRIAFFDPLSQQLRDVTFVQSLAPAN